MNMSLRRSAGFLVWLLQAGLAYTMVRPGIQKFTGTMWSRMFDVWGYPDGFYLVIGAIEVVAGVGLLIPRVASAAALLLMAVMTGAAITLFSHGGDGIGELVLLLLLAIVAYARWRRMQILEPFAPAGRIPPARSI